MNPWYKLGPELQDYTVLDPEPLFKVGDTVQVIPTSWQHSAAENAGKPFVVVEVFKQQNHYKKPMSHYVLGEEEWTHGGIWEENLEAVTPIITDPYAWLLERQKLRKALKSDQFLALYAADGPTALGGLTAIKAAKRIAAFDAETQRILTGG